MTAALSSGASTGPARLIRRAEFLRVAAKGRKWTTPGLVVQAADNNDGLRVGYTASKKVGNAVARNRAKRRMRELVREMASSARDGVDLVVIAREATVRRPFDLLRQDLRQALTRLKVIAP